MAADNRETLLWIHARMIENEALLRFYLTRLETNAAILPGGFHIVINPAAARELTIEKLTPKHLCEQLALPVGREVA